MSDQYTPSTEEVLAHWDRSHTEVGAAALRRWLASVKAAAWSEGVAAQCAAYNMTPDAGPNPYREQETP